MSIHNEFKLHNGRNDPNVLRNFYTILSNKANPNGVGLVGNIVNSLSNPVNLERGMYDVGLRRLRYSPHAQTKVVRKTRTVQKILRPRITRRMISADKEIPQGPLFPHYEPPAKFTLKYQNTDKRFAEFISRINKSLEASKIKVSFNLRLLEGNTFLVTVNQLLDDPEDVLEISENLATLIGLKRKFFLVGSYTAEDITSEDIYKKLAAKTEFQISTVKNNYKANIITVDQQFQSLAVFYKHSETNFKNVFRNLTIRLLESSFNVDFNFDSQNKCRIFVGTPDGRKTDSISLPQSIVACLGFNHDNFFMGQEESIAAFNESEFRKITAKDQPFFKLGYSNKLFIAMKEPATMGVKDVLQALNHAFINEKFPEFDIKFQYGNGDMFVNEVPRDFAVELPIPVKRYFEIPLDAIFKNGTRIPVGHDVVVQEEIIREIKGEDEIIRVVSKSKRLLVLLNCVENQFYKNHFAPVLAEIAMSTDQNMEVEKEFNPVSFIPVNSQQLQILRVDFVDEYFQPWDLSNAETSVLQGSDLCRKTGRIFPGERKFSWVIFKRD
ncbi:unnamed protein product [Allacma fusca]|uniref:Uncharacterized protein n=1 Tax=Allacma fusca TaxID=39272 RepID=A0A8J2KNF1_9HEXA|nr:unnamed protein product [Allacma fusca]